MPIGAIIGAVVSIGSVIIGGVMDSQDADEVNRVGLQLANIARQDKFKVDAANERLSKMGLSHQKDILNFNKKEAKLSRVEREKDRKEREGDRQYGKREKFKADSLDFVNKNAQSRSLFLNSVRRAT